MEYKNDVSAVIERMGDSTILGLGQIIRYNNRPKLKEENVAEHSFYVISTVLKLVAYFGLPDEVKYKALEFATVHDIPEIFVGDIPYDTKVNNPELKDSIEQAEINSLKKNMPEFVDAYCQFVKEEKERTIPFLVTKLADTISVLQYSNLELELGNLTKSMREINVGAIARVERLAEELEQRIHDERDEA